MANAINNIFLLLACYGVAMLLLNIYNYITAKFEQYQIWKDIQKDKKNQIYQKKIEKIKNHAIDYYYTLAINNPMTLANYCADERINQLCKEKRITEFYSKMRAC